MVRLAVALGAVGLAGAVLGGSMTVNVTAKGDGRTVWTAALQADIDRLSASGGGVLHFPAGGYVTGTLRLKSGVTLDLASGASLLGNPDIADYANPDPFLDGGGAPMGHALIVAVDAENVGITGSGVIDGRGYLLKKNQRPYLKRPFLIRFVRCRGIAVRGVTLKNPGAWTLTFSGSREIAVAGVTIRTRDQHLSNNDGIDLDSCAEVRVSDCDIETGDDAFVIKSTLPEPSRAIRMERCVLSTGANAIKFGTESVGGFQDITVADCTVLRAGYSGIALMTEDGGDLCRVAISNIAMRRVSSPIFIRRGSRLRVFRDGPPRSVPGALRDVSITDVTVREQMLQMEETSGLPYRIPGIVVSGVPGFPVEDVRISKVRMTLDGGGTEDEGRMVLPELEKAYPECCMFGRAYPASAVYLRHVRGIVLKDVVWDFQTPDARPEVARIDAGGD